MTERDSADVERKPGAGIFGMMLLVFAVSAVLLVIFGLATKSPSDAGMTELGLHAAAQFLAMAFAVAGLVAFLFGLLSGSPRGIETGGWSAAVAVLCSAVYAAPGEWAMPIGLALVVVVPPITRVVAGRIASKLPQE